MSTGAHKRFGFDTEFSADGRVLREGGLRLTYTPDEVEVIKQEAYALGRTDSVAKAEAATAQHLREVATSVRGILGTIKNETQNLKQDYIALARLVGERLSAAAIQHFPEGLIKSIIESALEDIRTSPRLVVRMHPDTAVKIEGKLQDLAEEMGLVGQMVIRADPARTFGDCQIEWANGTAGVQHATTLTRIDAAIAAYINTNTKEHPNG